MRRRFDERVLRPSVAGRGLASWKQGSRAIEWPGVRLAWGSCDVSGALGERVESSLFCETLVVNPWTEGCAVQLKRRGLRSWRVGCVLQKCALVCAFRQTHGYAIHW